MKGKQNGAAHSLLSQGESGTWGRNASTMQSAYLPFFRARLLHPQSALASALLLLAVAVTPACSSPDDEETGGAPAQDGGAGGAVEAEGGGGGGGGQTPEPTPLNDLYLPSVAVDQSPANLDGFQASWDQVDSQVNALGPMVLGPSAAGGIEAAASSEDTLDTPWNVALLQLVSAPMAGQTIAGDLSFTITPDESAPGADYFTRLYLAVWSDKEECVLADWTESDSSNEWGLFEATSPSQAVPLASCEVPAGARLVLELGYTSKNEHAVSREGSIEYGGESSKLTFSQELLFLP